MKKLHKKPIFWIISCAALLIVTASVLILLHLPKSGGSPTAGDTNSAVSKENEQVSSGTETVDDAAYGTVVCRTNDTDDPEAEALLWELSANRVKKSGLPLIKIDSEEEKQAFLNAADDYYNTSNWNEPDNLEEFSNKLAVFDGAFFEKNSLFITYIYEGSGSVSHSVDSVTVTGDKMTAHLTRITPLFFTGDIAHWFIAFPVEKAQIEHCTDFAVQTASMRKSLYEALYTGDEPKEYTPKTVFEGEVVSLFEGITICPFTELYPGDYIDYLSIPYTLADGTLVSDVKAGDTVRVTHDGSVSKGYPVTVKTVYSIEIIKGAEDE